MHALCTASCKYKTCCLQASQDFNPVGRVVINRGDLFGEKLYVTAEGTYEPAVRRLTCSAAPVPESWRVASLAVLPASTALQLFGGRGRRRCDGWRRTYASLVCVCRTMRG